MHRAVALSALHSYCHVGGGNQPLLLAMKRPPRNPIRLAPWLYTIKIKIESGEYKCLSAGLTNQEVTCSVCFLCSFAPVFSPLTPSPWWNVNGKMHALVCPAGVSE